jgi:hypothetical protein
MSGRSEADREHDRRHPKTADVGALADDEMGELRRPKGDPQRYDKHGGKLDHDGKPATSEH